MDAEKLSKDQLHFYAEKLEKLETQSLPGTDNYDLSRRTIEELDEDELETLLATLLKLLDQVEKSYSDIAEEARNHAETLEFDPEG